MGMLERRGAWVVIALLCIGLGACGDGETPAVGAAPLELRALDGSTHRPIPSVGDQATVLLFSASDCPVANGYAPEIRAIYSDYVDRGVRFYLVNVEPNASAEALAEHAAQYDLPGPILMDRDHALAASVGAEVTPEAVVLRPGGGIAYRGRIDDQHRQLGARRPTATKRELRDALDSVLAGRPVAVPRAPAVGCYIEDWTDLPQAAPTFSRDVAPILFGHCVVCHREGESAPFPLWTYADAKAKRRQIVRVTRQGLMPPWLPAQGHTPFMDERHLTPLQIDTLARWVQGGAPEGDPSALPARPKFAPGWQRGAPDMVIKLAEPFEVPADGPELFRNFILEVPTERLRYVLAVEIRPGSPAAHHGILQLDQGRRSRSLARKDGVQGFGGMGLGLSSPPDGHFLAWTPGKRPTVVPAGMSWRLHPGSDFILQLHMTPTGKVEVLQPEIGLYFTDEAPSASPVSVVLYSEEIDLPPGMSDYVLEDELRLPVPVELHGLYPHAHYLCREMLGVAELPSGERRTLLQIDAWDFDWQDDYRLKEPMSLPAGTLLRFKYVYDNSDQNAANPNDPPKRVRFGQESTDEMGTLTLTLVPEAAHAQERAGNAAALDAAMLRRTIEKKPAEWSAYRKLGRLHLDMNDPAGAAALLQEALRLRPGYADAHVDLGSCFLAMGQAEAAEAELRKALTAEPRHALGKLQLARVFAARSDLAAAERWTTEALEEAPNLVAARVLLGTLLARKGKTEGALAQFERALALSPNDPEVHNNLATAHFELGHLERAKRYYTQAVTGNPEYFNAWFNLGRVQEALGNEAESREAIERARALNPNHPGLKE